MAQRWVVLGAGGMLGTDVVGAARAAGHDVTAATRADVDVTDHRSVASGVAGADVVVNCAAWTAVDDAEADEAGAFALNATAAATVARASAASGARLVHVSTDYVFDGAATEPYSEDAPLAPRSAYGRTKAAGEWAVRSHAPGALLVRTAWLYGEHGPCFPRTIARLLAERDEISVVDDQVGQPTWTVDVAQQVLALVAAGAPGGAYAATAAGRASWWEFARAVAAATGTDPERVRPTTSAAFVRPAPRPAFSVLGREATVGLGVEPISPWEQRWRQAAPAVLGPSVLGPSVLGPSVLGPAASRG